MDPETLDALDYNYLDGSRLSVAYSARGEYLERRHVAIVCCGLPVEQLNWGFLKPPCEDPAATAGEVAAYFTGRKLPFALSYRDTDSRLLEPLERLGWQRRREPTPGMARPMPASIPAPPPSLAIQRVRTPEELAAFREAAFLGFGYPLAAARLFLDDRLLALPGVSLYSGVVDGTVVATSLLVATGDVAGIYWVATLEAHRRRGYGEALTWAAVDGGRALGCGIASLQASKAGRPVYARMGFEHVLDYAHLLPPAAAKEPR